MSGNPQLPPDDGIRHYTFLCLTALGVMTLALYVRGLETWSLVPALAGAFFAVTRARIGPIAVLLLVTWLLCGQQWPGVHPWVLANAVADAVSVLFFDAEVIPFTQRISQLDRGRFRIWDLALCAGLLGFTAAHYRLQGVATQIFPADPRRMMAARRNQLSGPWRVHRPAGLVDTRELRSLLAPLPLWIGLGWLCWQWLKRRETDLDIDNRMWRLMLFSWLAGLVFLVAASLIRYLAQTQARPEEAALVLQEAVWRETSREQRRIQRWLVWGRLRKKKGVP